MNKLLLITGLMAASLSISPVKAQPSVDTESYSNESYSVEDQRRPERPGRQILLGQGYLGFNRTQLVFNTRTCQRGAGQMDAIRVRVDLADADIEYVRIQFGNGRTATANFRGEVRRGETTRWINFSSVGRSERERCVARVIVVGDTQNSNFWSRSLIRVYGRTSNRWP
jgi:hypothetical protein